MRLRVFEAPTMAEALAAMRRALGPDAVIVASREEARGVRITAAVDRRDDLESLLPVSPEPDPTEGLLRVLAWHGLPEAAGRRLLGTAGVGQAGDVTAALTLLLGPVCATTPPERSLHGVRLIVGLPGAGKTLVLAKLAAASRLAGRRVRVVCSDDGRAGEAARLRELLAPVGLAPEPVPDRPQALAEEAGRGDLVLVDMPGIAPGRGEELARLAEAVGRFRGRPLLVWPAGIDPEDACEAAANFAALGIRECIVTRLDLARRLGSVLAAPAHGLVLLGASLGASMARPVVPLAPGRLASLLVARAGNPEGTET